MNEPKQFVSKPVQIEAMQLKGDERDFHDVYLWVQSHVGSVKPQMDYVDGEPVPAKGVSIDPGTGFMEIWTLEGVMQAKPGDWIIRGLIGEFYPCKDEVFKAKYEEIDWNSNRVAMPEHIMDIVDPIPVQTMLKQQGEMQDGN